MSSQEDPTGWRVFIENVIEGSNYFRSSEYMQLLADLESQHAEIERLKKRPPHWHCGTHGDFDAMIAVGCPDCMRAARTKIQQLEELVNERR